MNFFTYKDYIKSIHALRLNAVMQVAEKGEEYQLRAKEKLTKNTHEELVKTLLKDKKEIAKFINNFLDYNLKIKYYDLEECNNKHIRKKFGYKDINIVYKLKKDNVFFFIDYQSKIEPKMFLRIINYCINIIYEWSKGEKIKKEMRYPIVVPIVIYTGKESWKKQQDFEEIQAENYQYDNYKIRPKYNLIDKKKITNQRILKDSIHYGINYTKRNWEKITPYIARIATDGELRAIKAERKVDDIRKAEFMKQYEKEEFEVIVASIGDKYLTVLYPDNMIYGRLYYNERYFHLGKDGYSIVGANGEKILIGDMFTAKLSKVNTANGEIVFSKKTNEVKNMYEERSKRRKKESEIE